MVSTEESFIPAGLLLGIEQLDRGGFSRFAAIKGRGTRKVFTLRQTVKIPHLEASEAAALGASEGRPALAVHWLLPGPEDQPLVRSRIVEISERFGSKPNSSESGNGQPCETGMHTEQAGR